MSRGILGINDLMSNISSKKVKPKIIRLVDVASAAGLSRATVSKVLLGSGGDSVRVSKETCERVQEIARDMGYTPNRAARQLKGISSQTLGVILDAEITPVMTERLFALEEESSLRGYRLLIGRTHHQAAEITAFLNEFEGRGIEGLICLFDQTQGFDHNVRRAFAGRSNLLFHGRQLCSNACAVQVDTADAIRQLVNHLVERGHTRIGMGLEHMEDRLMTVRKSAFETTMHARREPVNPQWIWNAEKPTFDPPAELIDAAIDHLVVRQGVDAIIASDDMWAVRFIQRLKARGLKVPEDVAVTGYDNLTIGTVIDPPLTTIDQQHAIYARTALDLLTQSISETIQGDQTIRTIPPRLVVRQSS